MLPSMGSPLALREDHRLIRSKPKYEIKLPLSSSSQRSQEGEWFRDFESWDPESIDGTHEAAYSEEVPIATLLEQKSKSTAAFISGVEVVMIEGALTAAGSGHRAALVPLSSKQLDSIVARVPSLPGFLEDHEMQALLGDEIMYVNNDFLRATARACVEYEVKDPADAAELGVNVDRLFDDKIGTLWTNVEYQLPEWRVLRQTGVNPHSVLRTFRRIDRTLCNPLSIMLELQYLWMDGSLPNMWWEQTAESERTTYSGLLFIDTNEAGFRPKLPMLVDEFVAHMESQTKDIREALLEYWVMAAGGKISKFIGSMGDEARSGVADGIDETKFVDGEGWDESSQEDVRFGVNNGKFKSLSSQKALKQRMTLEGIDVPMKGGKLSGEKDGEKSSGGAMVKNKAEHVVESSVVLMSRQLRGMCERSLQSLANLFEKLRSPVTAPYCIFIINLRLKRSGTRELTLELSGPVDVCLQPDLGEVRASVQSCVNNIVASARNYPRPEQVIGTGFGGKNSHFVANLQATSRHKKMNESAVTLNDAVVHDVLARIQGCVSDFYAEPAALLKNFVAINDVLTGAATIQVARTIKECIGPNAGTTVEGLEKLAVVCKELESVIDVIKSIVPDVCYFTMFEVRSAELKELLIRHVRSLLNQIMDAVVEENKHHMTAIHTTYQEIANTLVAEVTDCAELKSLQDYTTKAATTLADLYDQYIQSVNERIKFLSNHKFRLARDDVQALYTTFNWPWNIQAFLRRSFENQSNRKRELEDLLEEDQRKLENDINDIVKRVESIAENGNPMDFRKNVDRIAAIKRDIDQKQERADEIEVKETLLEVPHSDHGTRLEEVRQNIDPLDRLWVTIKTFVEKTHAWQETPLAEVDPEDAERTAEEIRRTLIKLGREFEKVGEKRASARRIAESLQNEVKDFATETVPLMLLICNPGMRERHWQDIEALTGLIIPKGEVLTLNLMLEIGLQHQTKEIEDICVSANKEYSLQIAMDKMEKEWEKMIFDTKEYRTSGTRILCGIDEIQQLLDDHIVKTQAMKGSRYIKPFLEQITKWEETLLTMQDILDNWLKVQSTWLYLVRK